MLTAAQLVTLAAQICQIPGKTAYVGQLLNLVLANYALTLDDDILRKTTTLVIGPTADIPHFYDLPSDYDRYYDIFYNVNGSVFYLNQFELKDLDKAYTASGIDSYPEWFATDVSEQDNPQPVIAFYPPPAQSLTLTIRYRPKHTDITTPESSSTVPWFNNQLILLKDLCVQAGDVADDTRTVRWEAEVERRMRKYLIMDDDKEGYSQSVQLDPRNFRLRGNLPPSKKLGF